MPQDSTYKYQVPQGDTVSHHSGKKASPAAIDTALAGIPSAAPLKNVQVQLTPEQQLSHELGNWFFGALFLILLVTLFFPRLFKRLKLLFYSRRAKAVYDDRQPDYHALLLQYLPYYRNLAADQQTRFLQRTVVFMTSKQFEYVEIAPEERMPLLISATAVQLTFGLEHYLMEHFEKIYVLHHDYHYGLNSVPFQGHVAHDGIYLSWSNFLKAYDDYHDGDNVGLHEMAHALAYVNFNVSEGRDDGFHDRFIRFSSTGRKVFDKMQDELSGGFLGSYAASRYEEFWAVCVENFFERPTSFKIQLPELYEAMCLLLNQDTLKAGVILNPIENA
ncbi:zinc-dependent peptidase [Paraflavitalea sp. CAU 1676]|uniref:zinc-dependent peptidase n=1 Tax=Paraflavitalea sp. CAU 1676 TaxID=3032598 RepID=UPI0023DB7725|nr:zinc-dependent peptidase [Paraflavitalea sp. CAU 1676]MDF2189396.1 zinc-dependent peptidase [Paraflavitalea sp. CAU 1676]